MQSQWHKIAENYTEIRFAPNNIAIIEIDSKKICIARHNDQLFAFAIQCPHAGALLSEGYIDALGNVVCPLHGYKYSIKNGHNTSGEGFHLKHWEVEIRDDGVFILQ